MKIDITQQGVFHIFRIEDDLNIISDLTELRILITGYLRQGKTNIAVSFTNVSYIYSGAIAVLVDCYKQVKDEHGKLCIVEPHPEILSIFKFLKLDTIFPLYETVEDLLQEQLGFEKTNLDNLV